jgi:glycosyltransferase involved in cell wall biosynthesis
MNHQPKVSVIIPCYNAEDTLQASVESVISQTLGNFEILIINDGSTDKSAMLIQALALREPRIKVFHRNNHGVSASRNFGVEVAKGEYIAFLDADDFWQKNKLSEHLKHFDSDAKIGVSYSKVGFLSHDAKPLSQSSRVVKHTLTPQEMLVENHLCTSSNIMVRKIAFEQTGGFDESMSFAEDQEWLFRMAYQGQWEIRGISDILVYYRTQVNSLSASPEKMEMGWLAFINKVKQYAPEFIDRHFQRANAIYLRYLARRALRQGQSPKIGLNYMYRALRSDWRICLTEPQRSLPTLACLYVLNLLPNKKPLSDKKVEI